MMWGFLNRKKTDEINLEQVYNKIEELNNKIIVLDKGFHDLKQDLSVLNDGFGRQLTVFFDEFNSNLNDFLEDLPLNECDCDCVCIDSEGLVDSHELLSEPVNVTDVDGVDYVRLIHEGLSNSNWVKIYNPNVLYFDGYNFISKFGKSFGKILFTIEMLDYLKDNLYEVCKRIYDVSFRSVYNELSMTEKPFKRLIFTILEGTFDNLEPFMKYSINKSINIDESVSESETKPEPVRKTRKSEDVWSLDNCKGDDFKIKSYNISNTNLIKFKTNKGREYILCDVLTLLYLDEYINKNTVYIADFNRLGKEWNVDTQKIEKICVNLLKGNLNMILEDIHDKYTKNVSFKFRNGFLFIKGHQTNILYRTVSEFIYELNNTSRPVQLLISYLYVHDFELDDLLYIMFNYNNQSLVGLLKI